MPRTTGLLSFLCLPFVAFCQDAPKPQLTARELFYTASTQQKAPTAARPAETAHKAPPTRPVQSAQPTRPVQLDTPPRRNDMLAGGAKLLTVSAGMPTSAPPPATGTPLGLKYSLLKLTNGQWEEVPTDSVFHTGDRIQFRVETNGPGYLYIISQGSSGTWKPMFPSPDVDGGSNHIEGFHTYTMPPKTRFYFDEQAGTEKLFLVFSREKEADLEQMIFSLQDGKAKPVAAPAPEREMPPVLRASIDDSSVGRLRNTYARDLIIEAVDPATPGGEKKESAVYIVNPTGSPDSRVMADLLLVHK